MVRRVKINGVRGRWVAEVEGKWLAVLHHLHRRGANGYEAAILPEHIGTKRLDDLLTALRENDLAVIQRDADPDTMARDGYVGVFRFTDLLIDKNTGISLRFTERYADPKT
ncbi:hypothetical protein R5H32_11060 [Defluviimonas sp. D31]|uniref:hypothetical protein n=1 Tax=Defluviimonas sp. D31 TaxID=3083253 RepID=UPI00296EE9FF|nr:hypothetical protein [Defluviimonas sp. D31]MDW4549893.1 hypothetical protein [Defluviimonas sp. D31]